MSPAERVVVGIDLGGTNVRAGVLDPGGQVRAWVQRPIQAERGPAEGVARIGAVVADALEQAGPVQLAAIGLGAAGPLDRERGLIQNPYTLPGWEDVDVLRPLAERFRVPIAFENDADAAALGEYWLGGGQGADRLYMVTVGTGIGVAFVQDGALYRGAGGFHPEGGHSVIDPSGPECYCGAHGCWESLAAGPAIARMGQAAAARAPGRLREMAGGDLSRIEAGTVAEAARQGDAAARGVMDAVGRAMALGLVNVISFFYPRTILLGGGIMASYDLMQGAMQAELSRHDVMAPIAGVEIALARLGGQAGVIGAGYAAWRLLDSP